MSINVRWRAPARALVATAAILLAAPGCDSRPAVESSTTEEGTVHGRVILDGKPVSGGEVVFNPANYQRKMAPASKAAIGEDGTYTVKTLTGSNTVMVSPKTAPRGKKGNDVPSKMIPFEVQAGDNTFDIELTTPGPPPSSR